MKNIVLFALILFSILTMARAQEFNDAQKAYLSENILKNPGFESGKTGWTFSGGTASLESSMVLAGKKAIVFNASGTVSIKQSSTLNITAFAQGGVQGLGYLNVMTSVQGLYLCPVKNGVSVTSNHDSQCYKFSGSGKWELGKIPFELGAGSNGIELLSTASVSGNIYLDKAFLGAQDLKQDVSRVETQSLFLQKDSATAAGSTMIMPQMVTSGSGLFTYNAATGFVTMLKKAVVTATLSYTAGAAAQTIAVIRITGSHNNEVASSTANISGMWMSVPITQTLNAGDTLSFYAYHAVGLQKATITAVEASSSSIYSTSADFFSTDSNTLTFKSTAITDSDPVGTYNTYSYAASTNTKTICTTAPTTAPSKDNGILIYARSFNASSSCANPARYDVKIATSGTVLPTRAIELYKNPASSTPRLSGLLDDLIIGNAEYGLRSKAYDKSNGVLTLDAATRSGSITSSAFIFSDDTSAASGYLVINAQKAKQAVVGEFNNIEKCADSYECTDSFSAYVVGSSASHSRENIDWINSITRTAAGDYTINLRQGVFSSIGPSCTVSIDANSAAIATTAATGSGAGATFLVRTFNTAGTLTDASFYVHCQKQGADYIGKTAKAVASDQNTRSPGVTNSQIYSAKFGGASGYGSNCTASPCALSSNLGGLFSSVTRSAVGTYQMVVNTSTQSDSTHSSCSCSAVTWGVSVNTCRSYWNGNNLDIQVINSTGAQADAAVMVLCHGLGK